MNARQNLIIANDKIITSDIDYCKYNTQTHKYDIHFHTGKMYSYNFNNVIWLKEPSVINPATVQVAHMGNKLFGISKIYIFSATWRKYWHICFENGTERDYEENTLEIVHSCLDDTSAQNVLNYLKQAASLVSIKSNDGTLLLSKQYEKLNFIGSDTAFAPYINPKKYRIKEFGNSVPIFPFGCNKSQFKAVKNALDNQMSIIEGPPGTGKTQTILNIIANLLVQGKTVQIVSNNNSATANILEKLSSAKYNMGFLVASLGSTNNKKRFIFEQTGIYPDVIHKWNFNESQSFFDEVRKRSESLNKIFQKQERCALARQELSELETELQYFEQYTSETEKCTDNISQRRKLSSKKLMTLWQECQWYADKGTSLSMLFKIKSIFIYGISNWSFYKKDMAEIVSVMQSLFYRTKESELVSEISSLEYDLSKCNAEKDINAFCDMSMRYLKSVLFSRYGHKEIRCIFKEEDLWKKHKNIQEEYPIVLSTTFSSRSSLCKDAKFDYIIMDEASQVDIATGALALSCASNAVIVGDTKQLPNVVTCDDKARLQAIFEFYHINGNYNLANYSFLQSVSNMLPDAPNTLLKEHYRCHPKIINFCNQKFYNGELVIMTQDTPENDVMSVAKTAKGNHEREHMNQRQIDVLMQEVLPAIHCAPSEIGIIAPYNNQVNAIRSVLSESGIDVATVHKFQGREKDAIILTTVDNEVTDFSDDPYLLNVAVSRAKQELCLVVSGNEQPAASNLADLINYIEYNNFSVKDSTIYSVFDYLYKQYTESRMEYLKKHERISEYDSENLMYALIKDVLKENNYPTLDVVCHQPLNMLIRDPNLLNDEECHYAMNSATHLDFLIYNKLSKKPVLAIEVDGFHYHKNGTRQAERDQIKNRILDLYHIPLLRFATNGSGEKAKLVTKLQEIMS